MRILMLNYEFPPLGGGASPMSFHLSKEIVKMGYQVDVITMGFKGLRRQEVLDNVNIYRVPCWRSRKDICHTREMLTYVAAAIPLCIRLHREKRYDFNHTHFIFPSGLLALILKKITGIKYIITVHGSDVAGYNPDRFKWQHKILQPLWHQVVRGADYLISPTQSLKGLIEAQNPHLQRDVTVIPHGFYFRNFDARIKQKRILMVSRLLRRKGFQYALLALKDMDMDYEVHIVGDGPYKKELEEISHQLKIKVKFWGWLDNSSMELKELYETSSIFVFPSESENFPIVLLEAMSARMAIITSKGSGCPEVVGDTAILVSPKDQNDIRRALLKLCSNPELQDTLGEKARKRVEECFAWPEIASQYVRIYQHLLNGTSLYGSTVEQ